MDKRLKPTPGIQWGETAEDPADQQAEEELKPRTPRILYSQSFGFCLLRALLGAFLGYLLRFATMLLKGG